MRARARPRGASRLRSVVNAVRIQVHGVSLFSRQEARTNELPEATGVEGARAALGLTAASRSSQALAGTSAALSVKTECEDSVRTEYDTHVRIIIPSFVARSR